jgi:hypothetical protein
MADEARLCVSVREKSCLNGHTSGLSRPPAHPNGPHGSPQRPDPHSCFPYEIPLL